MNPVSVGKDLSADGGPVYPGAVPSAQVFQDQRPVFPADDGVHPGDVGLFDPDVAIIIPTDDDQVVPNPEPLAVILPDQNSKGQVSHWQNPLLHTHGPNRKNSFGRESGTATFPDSLMCFINHRPRLPERK